MSVTEHLMRPGSGSIRFESTLPSRVMMQIRGLVDEALGGVGAGIVITKTRVDPVSIGDAATLGAATYHGPITARPSRLSLEFGGLGLWLDTYLDSTVTRSSGTPAQWVGDLVDNDLSAGTITTSGLSNVSRTFPAHSATNRQALDAWAALAGAEYRINPDLTIDVATAANLFKEAGDADTIVVTKDAEGADGRWRGIDGTMIDQALTQIGPSLATKAVALAEGDGAAIAKGSDTQSLNLNAPGGSAPSLVRVFSAPTEESANANSAATSFLNLQGARRQVSISSRTHHLPRYVKPGDEVYAFDPPSGLIDDTNRILFRGQMIAPIVVRLLSYTWPIEQGMGVYIRSNESTPTYIDVTDWVEWETGDTFWTVGDWSPPSYGPVNRTSPEIEQRVAGTGAQSGIYTDSGASIPNNSTTAITLTASSDPRGWLSSGNVSPDVAGKYKVTVDVRWPSGAYNRTNVQIRKNNTNVTGGLSNVADVSSGNSTNTVVAVVDMNGSSDQIDCELFQDSGSAQSPVDVLFLVEFLPGH